MGRGVARALFCIRQLGLPYNKAKILKKIRQLKKKRKKERKKKGKRKNKIDILAELRSRPIFGGSGSDTSKIKLLWLQLRLRLLVNCKAANYEFLTTKKKLFSSLIQNYRMYMFDFRNNFLYQGRKQGFGSAFFCGSGSWGFRGRGVGVKGKMIFLVFFTFQMILNNGG